MKRAIVEHMIEKLDIATAGFMERLKKVIASGMATPPPPIPPTLASIIKDAKTNVPTHSLGSRGHNGLCTHTLPNPRSWYFWILLH